MRFQQVAFLPLGSFDTIFLESYHRGECLVTATCLRAVVGCKQRHAFCKILLLEQIPFVSVEFDGDNKTVTFIHSHSFMSS